LINDVCFILDEENFEHTKGVIKSCNSKNGNTMAKRKWTKRQNTSKQPSNWARNSHTILKNSTISLKRPLLLKTNLLIRPEFGCTETV
jgi:hypothetical protein